MKEKFKLNNFENLDPEKLNDLKSTSSTIYIKLSSGILEYTKSSESPSKSMKENDLNLDDLDAYDLFLKQYQKTFLEFEKTGNLDLEKFWDLWNNANE